MTADRRAPRPPDARSVRPARSGPETATQRLARLLDMVPWLLQHPGVSVGEAAEEFGITQERVVADLELLFVCGTPGYSHSELIDASWEGGHIHLSNADEISRPLRLTRDEAVTLTAGLQALAGQLVNPEIAERTLAKIRKATTAGEPAGRIDLELDDGSQHPAMAVLKDAAERGRRVHLSYYVPSRDETTERDVDLMRILNLDGHWYLEAWCHRATDVRLFRLDRIESVAVLAEDGTPPPHAVPRADEVYVPGADDVTVVLEATRDAAWIADYYPNEGVERDPGVAGGAGGAEGMDGMDGMDGMVRVTLRVADPALVRRLVLRLGGAVRVVSPPELVDAVVTEARAALAAYER